MRRVQRHHCRKYKESPGFGPHPLDSPPGAEVAARKYLPRFSYGKSTMFEVMSARRTYGTKTVMVAG